MKTIQIPADIQATVVMALWDRMNNLTEMLRDSMANEFTADAVYAHLAQSYSETLGAMRAFGNIAWIRPEVIG